MSAEAWRLRAFTAETMGMVLSLHVRAEDTDRQDIAAAVNAAVDVFRRADRAFSPWKATSDLLRVRRGELALADADQWFPEVQSLTREAEERTGGLFTSVLTGPDGTRGWDPTGLVKGWAADRAADVLRGVEGIEFCLNASGDLVADGTADGSIPDLWRVGLADPFKPGQVRDVIELRRGALATSGTAERGQHIVDPRTGEPADVPEGSVSVTSPTALWADVWATVAFIDPDAVRRSDDGSTLVSILRRATTAP
jgi:thiamine biosynthesis lipoprotein